MTPLADGLADGLADLRVGMSAGLAFLIGQQAVDGYWRDYSLPVGGSEGWVTGYVTVALAQAASCAPGESVDALIDAARRGAEWLTLRRHYARGWGFNKRTGQDADSTAWAIRAIDAVGGSVDMVDRDFLASHWDVSGGVRTYLNGPGGWGRAHPEVTAVAVLALGPTHPDEVRSGLDYSRAIRLPDGSWPAYWWNTSHYATLLQVEMRSVLGCLSGDERPVISGKPEQRVNNAFDLACVVATSALSHLPAPITADLARELVALQLPDGSWPSSPCLRLTDPSDAAWRRGRSYPDQARIYTTATAVRALAWCLS